MQWKFLIVGPTSQIAKRRNSSMHFYSYKIKILTIATHSCPTFPDLPCHLILDTQWHISMRCRCNSLLPTCWNFNSAKGHGHGRKQKCTLMGGTGFFLFFNTTMLMKLRSRVKTCKLTQVHPQAGRFSWPQTALSSVARAKGSFSRTSWPWLPQPWAPALKYRASTGVYCRGQRCGNKDLPLK